MPNLPNPSTSTKIMPGEAARMLGVRTQTLAHMTTLHPIILPSGHRRYLLSEIQDLFNERAA